MLTLGFTNKFYTLWNVTSEIRYGSGQVIDGKFTGECWKETHNQFYKNLAMDYDTAVERIKEYAGELEWVENLDLRGTNGSFRTSEFIGERTVNKLEQYQFSFGKLYGADIREANDVWQLERAMRDENGPRRKAYARRRLIELGELIRYDWMDKIYDITSSEEMCWIPIKRKYATPRQIAKFNVDKLGGLFYNNGEKVTLNVKEIVAFQFDGKFGTTYVRKYITDDNKVVEYMGGNPLDISKEEFTAIKATIKHDNYNGGCTKLLRIKII